MVKVNDPSREIPPGHRLVPPDGGWGWMVLVGVILMNMLQPLPLGALGFLFNDILLTMDTTTAMASWIATLNYVTTTVTAPISTIICETYSCRCAGILGGILMASGMFLSYFVTRIELLFVTYGVLEGLGASLCRNACLIVLNQYFSRYYGIVTGMSTASMAFSKMVYSPVIQLVIDEYGLRKTFVFMSIALVNIVVGAAFFLPVTKHLKLVPDADDDDGRRASQVEKQDQLMRCSEEEADDERRRLLPMKQSNNCCQATPMVTKDDDDIDDQRDSSSCCNRWLHSGPLSKLDFNVLTDSNFYLICTATITCSVTFTYSGVFFPSLVIENGLTAMEAATIQSINSAFEILGRVATPLFLHFFQFPIHQFYALLMVITAMTIVGISTTTTFLGVTSFEVLQGIVFGGQVGLIAAIILHFLGPKKLPSGISFSYCIQGFATLVIGPIIGLLRDQTGTFRSCFFFMAGLNILCALCWIVKRFLVDTRKTN